MIVVNNISINSDASKINVNVSTGLGYNITSLKLWTEATFKNYVLAVDLNYKLEQVNNSEVFLITAEEAFVTNFSGIFFLEFETDEPIDPECSTCSLPLMAVVTNFNKYYICMTELVLKTNICDDFMFSREVCDSKSGNRAIAVNLLIDSVNQCLELGQFLEAIDLVRKLNKLCANCNNCHKLNSTNSCTSCGNVTTYYLN